MFCFLDVVQILCIGIVITSNAVQQFIATDIKPFARNHFLSVTLGGGSIDVLSAAYVFILCYLSLSSVHHFSLTGGLILTAV